jgi:poly(3-hydroxybutyrate) depolymerase
MAKYKQRSAENSNFSVATLHPSVPNWHATVGTFITGQAEIDDVDLLAIEMETKWGVDRLRLLVPVDLREKFDRQRYLLNRATWHGDLQDVIREAKRMCAAWRALDKAATAAGKPERAAEVWELALEDGRTVALVRTVDDARKVRPDGRFVDVYTLDEIGHLIHGFPALAKIRETFPGATVERVRTRIKDPLDAIPDSKAPIDDPIPF